MVCGASRWNKGGFVGSDLNSAAIGGKEVLVWRQVVLKSELYEIFLAVISGLIAFWGKRINAIFSVCFPILVVLNVIDPESDQGWATRLSPASEPRLSYRDRQSPWRRRSSVIGDAIRMPPGLALNQYLYLVARLAEKKGRLFPRPPKHHQCSTTSCCIFSDMFAWAQTRVFPFEQGLTFVWESQPYWL